MLIDRLKAVHPGWAEWGQLIALVTSLDFEFITSDYMGKFYMAAERLCFSELGDEPTWPEWLPAYVPALYGMKADDWAMAGGYADSFDGNAARQGSIFSPAGNDADLGYPMIDVPNDIYAFQSNSNGAVFFINKSLRVMYPNSDDERFEELDSLESFTRKNIQQVLDGKTWFDAYTGLKGFLLD